jgi:hypothetical protein
MKAIPQTRSARYIIYLPFYHIHMNRQTFYRTRGEQVHMNRQTFYRTGGEHVHMNRQTFYRTRGEHVHMNRQTCVCSCARARIECGRTCVCSCVLTVWYLYLLNNIFIIFIVIHDVALHRLLLTCIAFHTFDWSVPDEGYSRNA